MTSKLPAAAAFLLIFLLLRCILVRGMTSPLGDRPIEIPVRPSQRARSLCNTFGACGTARSISTNSGQWPGSARQPTHVANHHLTKAGEVLAQNPGQRRAYARQMRPYVSDNTGASTIGRGLEMHRNQYVRF